MFLAMTAEEMQNTTPLPDKIAFLGCHFSSEKPELVNLPQRLPPGGGIIVDDREPIPDCDPAAITRQLLQLSPAFVLLDFQRPPVVNSIKLAAAISRLPLPTPMPPDYAVKLNCPVFLPPVPPHVPIGEYIYPWAHREVWLELALDAVQITVTSQGSHAVAFPHAKFFDNAHTDSMLHCHYKITKKEDALQFYCYRTREDLAALLQVPLPQNVTHTIGLFQEIGNDLFEK